jgi:hypothetical protein
MLERSHFLNFKMVPRVEVKIAELGDSVYVRCLSAGERDDFENGNAELKGKNFRARLVVSCACDAQGVDLFRVEDVDAVSKLAGSVVEPIVGAAVKINKMSPEADGEQVKNSVSPPSTGLLSD